MFSFSAKRPAMPDPGLWAGNLYISTGLCMQSLIWVMVRAGRAGVSRHRYHIWQGRRIAPPVASSGHGTPAAIQPMRWMSIHQLMVDGIANNIGVAFEAHLFHDAGAIGTDGLHAQG